MHTAQYILEVQRGHDQTKHWNCVSIDLRLDYFWVTNIFINRSANRWFHFYGYIDKRAKEDNI